MTMGVIAAVAEFERDLLIERTNAGIARAKAAGKIPGRNPAFTNAWQRQELERLEAGESISALARAHQTTRQTIQRVKAKAAQTEREC
jgi:putative DNA-invertase from lambdoid prophage Rac